MDVCFNEIVKDRLMVSTFGSRDFVSCGFAKEKLEFEWLRKLKKDGRRDERVEMIERQRMRKGKVYLLLLLLLYRLTLLTRIFD